MKDGSSRYMTVQRQGCLFLDLVLSELLDETPIVYNNAVVLLWRDKLFAG